MLLSEYLYCGSMYHTDQVLSENGDSTAKFAIDDPQLDSCTLSSSFEECPDDEASMDTYQYDNFVGPYPLNDQIQIQQQNGHLYQHPQQQQQRQVTQPQLPSHVQQPRQLQQPQSQPQSQPQLQSQSQGLGQVHSQPQQAPQTLPQTSILEQIFVNVINTATTAIANVTTSSNSEGGAKSYENEQDFYKKIDTVISSPRQTQVPTNPIASSQKQQVPYHITSPRQVPVQQVPTTLIIENKSVSSNNSQKYPVNALTSPTPISRSTVDNQTKYMTFPPATQASTASSVGVPTTKIVGVVENKLCNQNASIPIVKVPLPVTNPIDSKAAVNNSKNNVDFIGTAPKSCITLPKRKRSNQISTPVLVTTKATPTSTPTSPIKSTVVPAILPSSIKSTVVPAVLPSSLTELLWVGLASPHEDNVIVTLKQLWKCLDADHHQQHRTGTAATTTSTVTKKQSSSLSKLRIQNQKKLRNSGGYTCIVGTLRKWYDVQIIQSIGLQVIYKALLGMDLQTHFIAMQVGIINVLLDAMTEYAQYELIQVTGCSIFLSFLIHRPPIPCIGTSASASASASIGTTGSTTGGVVVVADDNTATGSTTTTRTPVKIPNHLDIILTNLIEFKRHKMIAVLLSAMNNYPTNYQIHFSCCWIFETLLVLTNNKFYTICQKYNIEHTILNTTQQLIHVDENNNNEITVDQQQQQQQQQQNLLSSNEESSSSSSIPTTSKLSIKGKQNEIDIIKTLLKKKVITVLSIIQEQKEEQYQACILFRKQQQKQDKLQQHIQQKHPLLRRFLC